MTKTGGIIAALLVKTKKVIESHYNGVCVKFSNQVASNKFLRGGSGKFPVEFQNHQVIQTCLLQQQTLFRK